MPDITVSGLGHVYGDNRVVGDLDFHVKDGEFFTLLGPSGCGKSTTLQSIAGFTNPTEGKISIGDTTLVDGSKKFYLAPERRDIGMVFQSYALFPHMTVEQNVAMPLKIKKVPAARRPEMIDSVLSKVGLGSHHKRYPHELSGGQQQRVALARALVYEPRVLLLDEPLSNLDAKLRIEAREWLKSLQQDSGITTIYVTHDQQEALYLSDRIAVLDQGSLVQVGAPHEVYDTPATPNAADFVGRCFFFDGVVTERGVATLDGTTAKVTVTDETIPAGTAVTIGVRPERLRVAKADGTPRIDRLPAQLIGSAYVGYGYDYLLRVGEHTVSVVEMDEVDATSPEIALIHPAYVFVK